MSVVTIALVLCVASAVYALCRAAAKYIEFRERVRRERRR